MRLNLDFYQRDVLKVAPELIGKYLVRNYPGGKVLKYQITEVEAYRGSEDLACHASKGKTERNEIMYHQGGHIYMYLIYGMYWMLNFVTSKEDIPQAVLIRGVGDIDGPGKLTQELQIDNSFYGENLASSNRIWVESSKKIVKWEATPRINIDYAGDVWSKKLWRYILV